MPDPHKQDRRAAEKLIECCVPGGVSHETWARLERFVDLLLRWQPTINLIAASTIPQIWTRHVADSLQLLSIVPADRVWMDLGSGAGFPGMAIACALADMPGVAIHLIESDQRKAAFLREAVRITGAPARVHAQRIEAVARAGPSLGGAKVEVITARALAPLPKLMDLAAPWLETGAQALFLKGQDIEAELTESAKYWHMDAELRPSVTDSRGRIVWVHRARRRSAPGASDDPQTPTS